jgi:SAM-dependent methyltransferase
MSLRKTIRRLFKKVAVARLYNRKSYIDAYAAHTDMRVREDPYTAIGEGWEELGRLQYDYLVAGGLEPHHDLLDIGCGTLRGGRHFIRYLHPERYTGMDISSEAIAFGGRLVEEEGLADRRPTLLVSANRDLRFGELAGRQFDFLLAQSVFSHLPAENIEECFTHVGQVMKPSSRFYFTFHEGARAERRGKKAFFYPLSFFQELAAGHGFTVERRGDYAHPSQTMVRMTRR